MKFMLEVNNLTADADTNARHVQRNLRRLFQDETIRVQAFIDPAGAVASDPLRAKPTPDLFTRLRDLARRWREEDAYRLGSEPDEMARDLADQLEDLLDKFSPPPVVGQDTP